MAVNCFAQASPDIPEGKQSRKEEDFDQMANGGCLRNIILDT